MQKVALKLDNTARNSNYLYNCTTKRQVTELKVGAPSTKQKYPGRQVNFAVFAAMGSILLKYIKTLGLA